MTSFFSDEEVRKLGFCDVGKNVLISRKASIYGAERIIIGNNVRIDDFCILSGKIKIGRNVHISAFCGLWGGKSGIVIDDFCTISSRCSIYALSDDYSGQYMTNPMVLEAFRGVTEEKVSLGMHVIIGTGSTILPGVKLEEGVSVGAMSLVNNSLEAWGMYAGIPCKKIKERSRNLLRFASQALL